MSFSSAESSATAPVPRSADAPIFVIGTGRSGTSLLRMMLCAHPRIYLTHEASFYVWDNLLPKRLSGEEFLRYYFETFSFRWLRLDPALILAELPRPFPRTQSRRLFTAVMKAKADSVGRPRFGDKTPSHAGSLGRIFADYPDARVVRIVRDPRSVVRSLSKMPWASASLVANAIFVESEHKQVQPFRERILEIRLEELLGETRATMKRVLEFVGEPWDDKVLDHAAHVACPKDMPPVPWFQAAARKRGTPSARWQDYSPAEIRLVERLTAGSLAGARYARAELPKEPSRLLVFGRWLSDLPEALRFLVRFARLGLMSRDRRNFQSPRAKALFQRLNAPCWKNYPGFEMPDPPRLPEGWPDCLDWKPSRKQNFKK